jgi:hypothetical protein
MSDQDRPESAIRMRRNTHSPKGGMERANSGEPYVQEDKGTLSDALGQESPGGTVQRLDREVVLRSAQRRSGGRARPLMASATIRTLKPSSR